MKEILVVLICIVILFVTCSCNGVHTTISYIKPAGREIIKVNAEPSGDSIFFKANTYISDVSVNVMKYDYENDEYSLSKKVYEEIYLNTSQALEIVVDLKSEIPYVMVEFESDGKIYNQYIYKNNKDGKLWLLER